VINNETAAVFHVFLERLHRFRRPINTVVITDDHIVVGKVRSECRHVPSESLTVGIRSISARCGRCGGDIDGKAP
jgi:hypothetical protein